MPFKILNEVKKKKKNSGMVSCNAQKHAEVTLVMQEMQFLILLCFYAKPYDKWMSWGGEGA